MYNMHNVYTYTYVRTRMSSYMHKPWNHHACMLPRVPQSPLSGHPASQAVKQKIIALHSPPERSDWVFHLVDGR